MKRVLAGALAAATLITASPAQAAVDPVKALKKQLVAGHGVKVSETDRATSSDHKTDATFRMTGVLEFGASGIVASDFTVRYVSRKRKADPMPMRWVSVGRDIYLQSTSGLPEGKTWVHLDLRGPLISFQPTDLSRPVVLKGLIAHAKTAKAGVYRGSITQEQVRRLNGKSGTGFAYRLDIGPKGLPERLITDEKLDFGTYGWMRDAVTTRYTDWGTKVTIKAPPEEQVVDSKDLTGAAFDELMEEIKSIPDGALAHR
ncbi:hypothetical protein [Nonomuraea sp. NPDC050786]|uniref:hypothetical protein n=1 Tax=Nonomuraea sp. NPDC050786 TaxID=3154840 RepID=UPI0033E748FF